jgi:hypothetical protein
MGSNFFPRLVLWPAPLIPALGKTLCSFLASPLHARQLKDLIHDSNSCSVWIIHSRHDSPQSFEDYTLVGCFSVTICRQLHLMASLYYTASLTPSPCARVCNLCPLSRRHRATRLLQRDKISSGLRMYPKRVPNTSHLDGYYPVPRKHCAFP